MDIPLFGCIDKSQYIVPILYCEIGLGNYMMKLFFNWVNLRVEMVTNVEIEKRNKYDRCMSVRLP